MAGLSAVVMAHPSRREFVEELLPKLDRPVGVVYDYHDNRWETGRRALLAFNPDASHHLVLQDDAIPCRDLIAGTERAAEAAGEHPIALYTGKVRPSQHIIKPRVNRAKAKCIPWFEHEGPWWGVGIVVPTADIPELIEWCDGHKVSNYDLRICHFYGRRKKIRCRYTVPSLVDHRPINENPSLVAGRTANRQARWFIGADRSALEIDWDKEPM